MVRLCTDLGSYAGVSFLFYVWVLIYKSQYLSILVVPEFPAARNCANSASPVILFLCCSFVLLLSNLQYRTVRTHVNVTINLPLIS